MIAQRTAGRKNPKIGFHVPLGLKGSVTRAARDARLTMSQWVREAMYEKLERDGYGAYPRGQAR